MGLVVPESNKKMIMVSNESIEKWQDLPRYAEIKDSRKVDVEVSKNEQLPFFLDIKETD